MRVEQIKTEKAKPFILKKHYAKRMPSISYAFGLFTDEGMIGIVTYGTPASSTLLRGVCGEAYKDNVLELNRLVVNNSDKSNLCSFLISRSIKMLGDKIIVSYADTGKNHNGYVYQASNFLYTGLSSKFRDPKVKGLEHQHHATYANGKTNSELKEEFGDRLYFVDRTRKHRYVFFGGSKTFKRYAQKALNYEVCEYPKHKSEKYDCIDIPTRTTLMDFL